MKAAKSARKPASSSSRPFRKGHPHAGQSSIGSVFSIEQAPIAIAPIAQASSEQTSDRSFFCPTVGKRVMPGSVVRNRNLIVGYDEGGSIAFACYGY